MLMEREIPVCGCIGLRNIRFSNILGVDNDHGRYRITGCQRGEILPMIRRKGRVTDRLNDCWNLREGLIKWVNALVP